MNLTKPLQQSFKATHRNAVAIEDGPCEIKSYLLTIDDDQDESDRSTSIKFARNGHI